MKKLLILIAVLLVVGGGAYWLLAGQAAAPTLSPETLLYTSDAAKISFLYPRTYRLESHSDSFEGNPITVAVLMDKDTVIPDYSEGPVTITMLAVPNPEQLALIDWIKNKSISNFYLSGDKKLTPASVAGEQGFAYIYSGLYENDAVAVAHGTVVYLFFVSWTDSASPMRGDFQNLLKTVTFK